MSAMTGSYGPVGASTGKAMKAGSKIPKGYELGQLQQFTPEQMQLFQQMFGQVGDQSFLGKLAGGDQSMFEQMERPALQQFAGLQGQIASRFSGAGLGGRHSSGFQNAQTSAAQQFAQQLQSDRMGLQQQAIRDLAGMRHQLLSERPYEQFLTEKGPSGFAKFAGAALPIAGAAIGGAFGGPVGAYLGGSIGGMAGKAFL